MKSDKIKISMRLDSDLFFSTVGKIIDIKLPKECENMLADDAILQIVNDILQSVYSIFEKMFSGNEELLNVAIYHILHNTELINGCAKNSELIKQKSKLN